ncbi:MAG: glycosyltransferase [Paludibacteraceae bacterium]|nr:glycosyltransferase [Paludibacteraceae bacterium]
MIGLFNDVFPPIMDGVSLTVKNYADNIYAKGKEVTVVTPFAPGERVRVPYPIYYYTSIPVPMRKPYRFGMPGSKIVSLLKHIPFEIVHAHAPFSSGHLAMQIAHKQHIPLVATFHSKFRQDFERAIPFTPFVDFAVNHVVNFFNKADAVWVPQASVEPVLREYGYKGEVSVVENGNDFVSPIEEVNYLREKARKELGMKEGEMMFLFVGQHIWEKNIGFVLEALAKIKHLPYKFFTIGKGYAEQQIRQKIVELGLEDKATLLGAVYDRDILKSYYAAADLFLFPSLYDNAPLVVREAAAMHTPSVMLAGSTAAEVIDDQQNGFLCVNDPNEYAQLLAYLIDHPQEVKRVGDKASVTLTRSWNDIVTEVLERYKEIEAKYKKERGL